MTDRSRLAVALKQIDFARDYTLSLIGDVEDELWFTIPGECVTHVAWQVGHLAMAQYGLCLFRLRGRQEIDTELMSSAFRKKFSKGTTPDPDVKKNPTASEIRDVLARVQNQVRKELPRYSDAELGDPVEFPYSVEATKLGSLYFCAAHEMLHAGQIGLLRRLLGKQPVR